MTNIDNFDKFTIGEVLQAYLIKEQSQRTIQRKILGLPAPARGGGFVAMEILHYFNIDGDKKGILNRSSASELKNTDDKKFIAALNIIEERNNLAEEAEEYFAKNKKINKNNNPTESKSELKTRIYQNKLRKIVLDNYN